MSIATLLSEEAPSAASGHRRWRPRMDVANVLIVYVALLFGIPSALIVGPLGAAGTPAGIFAVVLLLWWCNERIRLHAILARGFQPIRAIMYFFQLSILASYVSGMLRPITGEEVRSSDRGLISLAAWSGAAFVAADGLSSRERLDRLLRALVAAATALAALGMLQFFFGIDIASYLRVPGLTANVGFGELSERSSFRRVTGTTMHPIEFGVVIALVLPIALHYAFHAPEKTRRRQWIMVAMMGAALPMCVARSAILGGAIALALSYPTWSKTARLRALVILPLGAALMRLLVPGLLGTIRSLFVDIGNDPSTQGRTADYVASGHYILQDPVFGRGFDTFLPDLYRTLDNAYLGTLIEAGLVGLVALLGLFVCAMLTTRRVRLSSAHSEDRSLAHALFTSVAVALVTFATFDALGFRMCAGTTFLILGCCGALWRLQLVRAGEREVDVTHARPTAATQKQRIIVRSTALAGILATLSIAKQEIANVPKEYEALGATIVTVQPQEGTNPYVYSPDVTIATYALNQVLISQQMRDSLHAAGLAADYTVAQPGGSLNEGTDRIGSGPSLTVASVNRNPTVAVSTVNRVLDEVGVELADWQQAWSVPDSKLIRSEVLARPIGAVEVDGSPKRALVGVALLTVAGWATLGRVASRRLRRREHGR